MSAQPEEPNVRSIGNPSIPQFEGEPVQALQVKVSGLSTVTSQDMPAFTVDDRVRLIGEFKCIGVRHVRDKNGNLVREQIVTPMDVDVCPYDPDDPNDDGVVRARGH